MEDIIKIDEILIAIAKAGGCFTNEEIKIINNNFFKHSDIFLDKKGNVKEYLDDSKIEELVKSIISEKSKTDLILNMCMLCLCEKKIDKKESDLIIHLLDILDFDKGVKNKAKEFINAGIELSDLLNIYIQSDNTVLDNAQIEHDFLQISKILLVIARANECLTDKEMEIIQNSLFQYGETTLEKEDFFNGDSNVSQIEDTVKHITNERTKALLILQLCMMPFADQWKDNIELDISFKVLDLLNFNQEIKEKTKKLMILSKEFSILINPLIAEVRN